MKKLIPLVLFVALALGAMAQRFNTYILPSPQKVELHDGTVNIYSSEQLSFTWDNPASEKDIAKTIKANGFVYGEKKVDHIEGARNQKQAYRLEITPNQVMLYFVGGEGLRNGRNAFSQLSHRWEDSLPCMTITDWPDFEYRGWMDDYSRGPIANEKFRKKSEQLLLNCGYNYYTYYTEHIYYNPLYPDIAPHPDATLSGENDGLMANLQCFAHFEKTLRIPFYINMKDSKFNVDPSKEETYDFLNQQIKNIVQAYPKAKFFNINCDETEALGSGRAKDYVSRIGEEEAYVEHINKVYNLLKPYDKEVLMWGDIVGKKPEMLEKLPKDMQYIIWSYVPSDSFEEMIAPFKKLHDKYGTQFWIACGVSHWSSIFPSHHNYIKNIANFARDGYKAGARGFMNTVWDDSGESLLMDCWFAMMWGGEMGWNSVKPADGQTYEEALAERLENFKESYDYWTNWYYSKKDISALNIAIGDLWKDPTVGDWMSVSALYEPLLDFYPSKVDSAAWNRCQKVYNLASGIHKEFNLHNLSYPNLSEHDAMTSIAAADYALRRLCLTSMKGQLRIMIYRMLYGDDLPMSLFRDYNKLKDQYFKELHKLKCDYLRMWDYECTEYSRDIICERYDNLGHEILEAEQHVFISTYLKNGKTKVELKTLSNRPIYYTLDGRKPSEGSLLYKGQSFDLDRSCEVKAVCYNQYGDAVETSKYLLFHKGMGHLKKLNTQYSTYRDTYSAGGDNALLDGEMGSETTYNDGHWQGYWGQDIDVEIDLGVKTAVKRLSMRFMQNTTDWILSPKKIEVYTSLDGKKWTLVRTEEFEPDYRQSGNVIRNDAVNDLKLQTRYLRVVAKNPGLLPSYSPGAGYDSYLFCDEIVIE